jgi:uncharacterized tellurite resistance protein B-like protein
VSLLDRLRGLAAGVSAPQSPQGREAAVRLATAALLVEVIRADFEVTAGERTALAALLEGHFGLSAQQAGELLASAETAADLAVSLYEFTRALNDALDAAEKARVVELLWRACLADGRLDHYEEHLVRKVAELLYVPHADLVRLRHRVRGS